MRRALVVAAVLLLSARSARGDYGWQEPQNTNGYVSVVSPPGGSCFLYETAAFDIQCYTAIPSGFISVPNGVLEGVANAITGYSATAGRVQIGAASGGGLRDYSSLTFDGTNLGLGSPVSGVQQAMQGFVAGTFAQIIAFPQGGTGAGEVFNLIPKGAGSGSIASSIQMYNTDAFADPVNFERLTIQARGTSGYVIAPVAAGTGTVRALAIGTDSSVAPVQLVLNTDGSVTFGRGDLLLSRAAAQAITKSNGALTVGTTGANAMTLKTNGSTAVTIDSTQGFTFPTFAGGGTQCAQFDNTGKLGVTGSACGSGGLGGASGTVTNVTGTPPIFITGTPATTPNVTIQGAITSGSTSTTAQNLGSGASGVEQQTVSAGVATLSQFQCTANQLVYGAASGGGLAQSSDFAVDPTIHQIQMSFSRASGANGLLVNNTSGGTAALSDIRFQNDASKIAEIYLTSSTYTGTEAGPSALALSTGAAQPIYLSPSNTPEIKVTSATGTEFLADTYLDTILSAGILKTNSSGKIIGSSFAACTDYVSLSCVSGATDLGGSNATPTVTGIESAATMRGSIVATEIAAPAVPAAGKITCWAGNFSDNWMCESNGGAVNHGTRSYTCGASTFATSETDNGVTTCTQPGFTNLSGSLSCGQLPGFTGDVSKAAGSCTTAVLGLTDGATVDWPTNGTWANNQALITSGGKITATNECNVMSTCSAGGGLSGTYPNPTVASVPCSALPALTGDATSAGGTCATTLATVATAGTYGTSVNVIRSITIDAKGRTTSISTSNKPQAITLSWAMLQSGMSMGQDRSQLIFPGIATAPMATINATAGTSVRTTMANAWGTAISPPTFPVRESYNGYDLTIDVPIVAATGPGSATLEFELYEVVTSPGTAANYTALCNTQMSGIVSGAQSSFGTLGCTGTTTATNASFLLVAYRNDVNNFMTINNLQFQAIARLWATP